METEKTRLDWALALAAQGFKILELRPDDKRPVAEYLYVLPSRFVKMRSEEAE